MSTNDKIKETIGKLQKDFTKNPEIAAKEGNYDFVKNDEF